MRSNFYYRIFPFFLFLGLFSGCVANQSRYSEPLYEMELIDRPDTNNWQIEKVSEQQLEQLEPGYKPASDSDEGGIWYTMEKAEMELKNSGALLRDDELSAYLREISCNLAPEYCNDIRIYVLKAPYFNASMAPNGSLVIWTGLLLRAQNEAQLAAVIGHEMGHYLRRHSLQRLRDTINTTSTLAFVRVATAAVGLGIVGDVAFLAGAGGLQAFSRDMEREADGYGIALMSRAGYDPREIANLWNQVIKEKEADEDENFSMLLFDSHPPSEERLEALASLADEIIARNSRSYKLEKQRYRDILAPHLGDFLQADLHLRNFSRSDVLLQLLNEQNPGNGTFLFYQAEMYRLRCKEGDKKKALELYRKAAGLNGAPAEVYRAIGLLEREQGNIELARNAFEEYLLKSPDAADKEMIEHMLQRNSL